ncbi:hypothetical protein P7C73_g5028, partial [Tremellales sp. Uapishka_1]
MLASAGDARTLLEKGPRLFGPGWRAVGSFDDLDDIDDFEDEEEEIYVTMDLGTSTDGKVLLTESHYQLIGMDTPMPFLKVGDQVFQGEVTPLIGEDVILGLIRNQENPHNPNHPPIYSTSHRITFRGVTLTSAEDAGPAQGEATEAAGPRRTLFPHRSAATGSNVKRGEGSTSPSKEDPKRKPGRPRGSGTKKNALNSLADEDSLSSRIDGVATSSPGEDPLPSVGKGKKKASRERLLGSGPKKGKNKGAEDQEEGRGSEAAAERRRSEDTPLQGEAQQQGDEVTTHAGDEEGAMDEDEEIPWNVVGEETPTRRD